MEVLSLVSMLLTINLTAALSGHEVVISAKSDSTCDDVVKGPHRLGSSYNAMFEERTKAQILMSTFSNKLLMAQHQMTCQNLLMILENNTEVNQLNQYYLSSISPIQLVIVISSVSHNELMRQEVLFFNIRIIKQNNNALKVMEYDAMRDGRWRRLNVVFLEWIPSIYTNSEGNIVGVTYDIWKIIGEKVGFTMSFSSKSSYSEMYKNIANGTADLALPADSLNPSMLEISHMTHYNNFEVFRFYNIKPGPATSLLTLTYPFNGHVWLLTLCATCFVLAAIFFINLKTSISLFHSIQILLSSIVSDSVSSNLIRNLKNNWYGCVILPLWFLSGLLLLSAYSSNLLASLMVVEKTKPDNTFEDLVTNKRTLGVPRDTFIDIWLKTSPREIVRRAEKECAAERNGYYDLGFTELTPPTLTDKLDSGEASSIIMESIYHSVLEHKYRLGTDILMEAFSTYYMRKKHPLTPYIDATIAHLTSSGIIDELRKRSNWANGKHMRDFYRMEEIAALIKPKISIKHLGALWIIQLVGIVAACIGFFHELMKRRTSHSIRTVPTVVY